MAVNESKALVTMTAVSSDKISTYRTDDIHLASLSSAGSLRLPHVLFGEKAFCYSC